MADGHRSANGWVIGAGASVIAVICTSVLQRMSQMERAQTAATALWREKAKGFDDWIGEHDRRIEARDASQWERIKSLERVVFGEATPITIAPGEEP